MWKITIINDASTANATEAAMLALASETGSAYNVVNLTFSCDTQDRLLRILAMLTAMDLTYKKVVYEAI